MGFSDYDISLATRDFLEEMITKIIKKVIPPSRDVTVISIDRTNRYCMVEYPEGGDLVRVEMGAIQPKNVGQIVRVAGPPSDRRIIDVFGGAQLDPG